MQPALKRSEAALPEARRRPPTWGWLRVPAGRGSVLALGLAILAAPLWLWSDPLDGYAPGSKYEVGLVARFERLIEPTAEAWFVSDDFDYAAEARTASDLRRSLWVPHNSHVVPLFRIWTYAWVRVAGTLARLPATLLVASGITYLAAMLMVGRLVGRESGRPALGLAAMAALGVSAVLEPTVRWYSAGQAIAAADCILAMLVFLQGWRDRGGWGRLLGAGLMTAAAPLVWTIGLVAGPVGAAYLWADGRPRARRVAIVPLLATAAVAAAVFGLAGREVIAPKNFHGRDLTAAADPVQGAMSSAQAIVEVVALRNFFGLAADTTVPQAAALLALGAIVWTVGRGRPWRPNPLEAAGATLTVLAAVMVYTARGYYPYEQLRDIHWYHAAPVVGGVLFAGGWWIGRQSGPPPGRRAPTRGELLAVAGLVVVALTLQAPRLRANLVASVPPLLASERRIFPLPTLQQFRARYLRTARSIQQRRDFAWLDQAEALAQAEGWSRSAIRAAVGGPNGPKVPVHIPKAPGFDPVALLALPEDGPAVPAAPIRSALLPLLTPTLEPRPDWIAPAEHWPPTRDEAGR